jgi:DNA-binding NarL/FixJ family response regulator
MKPTLSPSPERDSKRDNKGDDKRDNPRDVSPRERELLQWLADGVRSSDVAERLGKPAAAVRAHAARLLRQLRAATPAEALARLERDADDHGDDEQEDDAADQVLFEDGNTTEV